MSRVTVTGEPVEDPVEAITLGLNLVRQSLARLTVAQKTVYCTQAIQIALTLLKSAIAVAPPRTRKLYAELVLDRLRDDLPCTLRRVLIDESGKPVGSIEQPISFEEAERMAGESLRVP